MGKTQSLLKDKKAVSPVIGVILMVAITVVMAGIVGQFVYGYGSSMEKQEIVSTTARHHGDTITVTYTGGPDQGLLHWFNTSIDGTEVNTKENPPVGYTYSASAYYGRDNHIVVTARWTDDTTDVILDTYC